MPLQEIKVKKAPTFSIKAMNLLGVNISEVQPKPKLEKRDTYAVEAKQSTKCVIL